MSTLGQWLSDQRGAQRDGLMRVDRKSKLDSLGTWFFAGDGELRQLLLDPIWHGKFLQLQAWVNEQQRDVSSAI